MTCPKCLGKTEDEPDGSYCPKCDEYYPKDVIEEWLAENE